MAYLGERPPIVVGVDLGNANCRFAAWQDPGEGSVLADATGIPIYPAIVARDQEQGGWLVGQSAAEESYRDSVQVYRRLKENILAGEREVQQAVQRLLSKLKASFQAERAARVVGAVLAVPYRYTAGQRAALREAASLAGLPVVGLINEPEAAVLGYRVDQQLEGDAENVLVFDAGATQCTVSVVRVSRLAAYLDVELLSEAMARTEEGDPVGGDAMDDQLYARFREGRLQIPAFPASVQDDPSGDFDPVQHQRWLEHQARARLREARHFLSGQAVHEFDVPWDGRATGRLTRDDLERWASFDLELGAAVQAAVRGARDRDHPDGLRETDIHRVLVVGGLNRSPFVSQRVDHFRRVEPRDEGFEAVAVSVGAARCAAILTGRCDDTVFRPRETPAYGIRTGLDTFDKVIPENAPPRFRGQRVYTLPNHYAQKMVLEVCQGFSRRFLPEMSLGREEVPLAFPEGSGPGRYLEREIHIEMEVAGSEVMVQVLDKTRGIAHPVPQHFRFRTR